MAHEPSIEPSAAADLVDAGVVTPAQAYRAAVLLERLQDRGAAVHLTLREMCEVLGYTGENRPPRRTDIDELFDARFAGWW